MLNKVPINSPFINGHNQCSGEGAGQLTLLTRGKEGLKAEEKEGERGGEEATFLPFSFLVEG